MADEVAGTSAEAGSEDLRKKFREALDSKQGHGAVGGKKGGDPSGQPHHASGPAKTQRSFRRKSGG
jgi:hypothetical protein